MNRATYTFAGDEAGDVSFRFPLWRTLSTAHFEAWVVVVDKQRLPDVLRIMPSRTFYGWFLNETVQLAPETLRADASLWLDESDRAGKTVAEFKRIANQRGLRYGFRRIRAIRSSSESLVQIADLIAGAVLRQYDRGDAEAFDQVVRKIAAIAEYPTQQNPLG